MTDPAPTIAFFVASGAIILAPGPAQALVLARTFESGRRAGVLTAIGLNAAVLVHATAAGLGLSALLATSSLAFTAVKLVGAGYLVLLGLRALRGDPAGKPQSGRAAATGAGLLLAQAFLTGVLNPKVALFFVAFLPQFVHVSAGPVLPQFLVLGALLGLLDVVYETALVFLASGASRWLASPLVESWRARVTGGILIGLGLRLAVSRRG